MSKITNKIVHHNYWYWGESYYIILNNGVAFASLQIDKRLPESGCITHLSVIESERKSGLGNAILTECEKLAKELKLSEVYLTAEKSSPFVFEWYKRHGYIKDKYDNKYLHRLTKKLD